MVDARRRMAEQRIDLETKTEFLRGQPVDVITGRVLLHAVDEHGRADCGTADLIATDRAWDTAYLPHVPRCQGCAGDAPASGPEATGMDIRTAHDSEPEHTAVAALRAVLAEHDLRRWMCTDVITVDESLRGGASHPLTIGAVLLTRRPAMTLTSFLHEQMHWVSGTDSATAEAAQRWPDPPSMADGGASDAASTWLHMAVCALEYQSLCELIGTAAATEELRQHNGYRWIYGQILDDPDWFADFLLRHELGVPEQPPIPRRCFSEPWWR